MHKNVGWEGQQVARVVVRQLGVRGALQAGGLAVCFNGEFGGELKVGVALGDLFGTGRRWEDLGVDGPRGRQEERHCIEVKVTCARFKAAGVS